VPEAPEAPPASPVPQDRALLLRSVGPLPPDLVAAAAGVDGVQAVSPVRAGALQLTGSRAADGRVVDAPAPGWNLPVEVIAVDPAVYGAVLPSADTTWLAGLEPGFALLGDTSARIRRLTPGAAIELGGKTLTIGGVAPDHLIGSAEVVVTAADADRFGVGGLRYALLRVRDGANPWEPLQRLLAGREGVLLRDLGHAPWQPAWREVLPQAVVKERFGEFAIRPGVGRAMAQEPGWVERHIVTANVPILGTVRCHRAIVPALTAALAELEVRGLGSLVDRRDYAGCFGPRLIAAGAGPSRHAWGIAVDLNARANPFGAVSRQDSRLVEIMERHGFGFGGRWPVPDAMHFEYRDAARL
jgi:hypothetical protein